MAKKKKTSPKPLTAKEKEIMEKCERMAKQFVRGYKKGGKEYPSRCRSKKGGKKSGRISGEKAVEAGVTCRLGDEGKVTCNVVPEEKSSNISLREKLEWWDKNINVYIERLSKKFDDINGSNMKNVLGSGADSETIAKYYAPILVGSGMENNVEIGILVLLWSNVIQLIEELDNAMEGSDLKKSSSIAVQLSENFYTLWEKYPDDKDMKNLSEAFSILSTLFKNIANMGKYAFTAEEGEDTAVLARVMFMAVALGNMTEVLD